MAAEAASSSEFGHLSHAERDRLADAIRGEWSGGRWARSAWDDIPLEYKDRWRTEVDMLPFEEILTGHVADALQAAADYVTPKNWTGPNGTLLHLNQWLSHRAKEVRDA